MSGTLYLCATPIGNLEDMTYRCIRILNEVDIIAAEDTRNSIKLLNHFDIHTPMTSYHHNNRFDKSEYLISLLKEDKNIALISDAGMPGISDPGEELVKECIREKIRICPIPGATAGLSALVCSGLSAKSFCFEGFLPAATKEQRERLELLKNEVRTIIFYEAPHRLKKTLEAIYQSLGERRIAVCKELTKKHEEFRYFSVTEAISYYNDNEPRGEFVIVVEGRSNEELKREKIEDFQAMNLEEHMDIYLKDGLDRKDAMKKVAKDRGVSKRDIYEALLKK